MATGIKWIDFSEAPEVFFGAEGDEGQENDEGSNDDKSGDKPKPGDENAGGISDNDSDDDDDDSNDPDDRKELKGALANERRLRKAAEKEAAKAKKEKDDRDLAEKSELEQATTKLQKSEEKVTKLAAGFRNKAVNSSIEKAAEKLGFIDIDDALNGVDRSKIEVEQDDDDPSDVTVDDGQVAQLVKALAKKKSHFLKSGTDDGEPTGGQFGGSKPKPKSKQENLKEIYPSLA